MKGLFPQFDPSSVRDFEKIWGEALFVFDTNVLLNLYRYQSSTRDQLLEVLTKLSDRIWIPHHVALEFQRNRIKVIADQNNRFFEVRKAVTSSTDGLRNELGKLQLSQRHSLINPEPLTSGFDELAQKFLEELNEIQKKQQSLTSPDPIKEKIEDLFDGRVGKEPKDQKTLDEVYKRAEKRYASQIAPGYIDQNKDKKGPDEHLHNGLVYKKKFGDYLVWCQLLDHAKTSNDKSVIFVTDDGKEDWWWSVKSDGAKTLGPRPELLDEASSIGDLSDFLMYKPSAFLNYANEFLSAKISNETLEEVRDVSEVRSRRREHFQDIRHTAYRAERAVFEWLVHGFSEVHHNERAFPDFVVRDHDRRLGFEVKVISSPRSVFMRLRDIAYRAHFDVVEGDLDMVTIVLVASSPSDTEEMMQILQNRPIEKMPETIRVLIGGLEEDDNGEGVFTPFRELALNDPGSLF